MIDYAPGLTAGLAAVLPTWAEPVDKKTPVPCITWMETDRRDLHAVNGLQVSTLSIRVRVWADSRGDLADYASRAEAALRGMGWRVAGGGELAANGRFCHILACEATGWDKQSW